MSDVTSRFSSLAHDVITLAELQTRLAYLDLREAAARSALTAVSLAALVALMLGSLPVLLLGLSELLVANGWGRSTSYLVVGGATGALAMIAVITATLKLRRVFTVFSRSLKELQENLEFVKSLVSRDTDDHH